MRKFVTIVIIIISIVSGALFIKAMFELAKEASSYLESKNEIEKQDDSASKNDDETPTPDSQTDLEINDKSRTIENNSLADNRTYKEQQESVINKLYNDFFNDITLSEQEVDQLRDLIIASRSPEIMNSETKTQSVDDDINDLLGDYYYQSFKDYNTTVPMRLFVFGYQKRLTSDGQILTDEQEQELIELIIDIDNTRQNLKNAGIEVSPNSAIKQEIVDNSRAFLNDSQLEILQEYINSPELVYISINHPSCIYSHPDRFCLCIRQVYAS